MALVVSASGPAADPRSIHPRGHKEPLMNFSITNLQETDGTVAFVNEAEPGAPELGIDGVVAWTPGSDETVARIGNFSNQNKSFTIYSVGAPGTCFFEATADVDLSASSNVSITGRLEVTVTESGVSARFVQGAVRQRTA